jgi:signal recognition particle subunit SRP54
MFEALGQKLQDIFEGMRRSGRLTEAQVRSAAREIRVALLEADVSLPVVRDFVAKVSAQAVGSEVLSSLNPAQQVVKIVRDELTLVLGGESRQPVLQGDRNVWFLVGLQGAGKTSTAGKLAQFYKSRGRRVLLVAADTQRPAARQQLKVLAAEVGVPVLEVADQEAPSVTAGRLKAQLESDFRDLVLVDTAGRLETSAELMEQLAALKAALQPSETVLVVDSMIGQAALSVAQTYQEKIGLSGLILTKLDGDARGGAALSARSVTGVPIYFATTSEKLSGLEPFHPDRVASRILGMGDVLTLIERAEQAELSASLPKKPGEFDLEDLVQQLRTIRKMGPLGDVIKMIPGMSRMVPKDAKVDERQLVRIEAMIGSMTQKERREPRVINGSRRKRIAAGSGTTVQEVNQLLRMHEQMKGLAKLLSGPGSKKLPGWPLR